MRSILASVSPVTSASPETKGPTPYPQDDKNWPGKGPIRGKDFAWVPGERAVFWAHRTEEKRAIVFAGDSLTGGWKSLAQDFPDLKVANRGVGGDVSRALLFRFNEDVLSFNPKAVVIEIGNNDLTAGDRMGSTLSNIAEMIDLVAKRDPQLSVIVCTIPPSAKPDAPIDPAVRNALNERIRKLPQNKSNVYLCDVAAAVSNADGSFNPEYYCSDKLHLASAGYKKWAETIYPIFKKLKLTTHLAAEPNPKSVTSSSRSATIPALAPIAGKGYQARWKLVWSDNFNYEGLPDPSKWDYEEGFLRNNEMQYYTRARRENARVEGGLLIIQARKERFPNPGYKAGSSNWKESREFVDYTSASLTSRVETGWKYGRIEVLAKLPDGKGVWPAIWTLGMNKRLGWPACGEIDIMEFVGNWPGKIFGTIHYASSTGAHEKQEGQLKDIDPHSDFHSYAIEWGFDRIDFFFDSYKYHTAWLDKAGAGAENPFRKPNYLILNLALGGAWGGDIDDTSLPHTYLIKHVRMYESLSPPNGETYIGPVKNSH